MTPNLPDLAEGDELGAEWLNALRDLCMSAYLHLTGAGLVGVVGPNGSAVAALGDPSCWCKVLTLDSGSTYNVQEQIPTTSGGWQNGRTFKAKEVNGTPDLATDQPIVWAQYDPSSDTFSLQFGRCT